MSDQVKILIVDDTPDNILLLGDLLIAQGYKIVTASSGAEALTQVEREQPSLVLLDVVMPAMNGYEVCRQIRANPQTRLLPVVMVTSLDPAEERVKGIEAGADDFLSRPVNHEELFARVRSLLRIEQLHTQVTEQAAQLAEWQKKQELEAARHISLSLFQHLGVDELIQDALSRALEVVGAEAGVVFLAAQESQKLTCAYQIGDKTLLCGTDIPWDQGIEGAVFHSGEPRMITDSTTLRADEAPSLDVMTGTKTRNLIVLPLKRWEGEPIGIMELLNKREGTFEDDDLPILTIISAFIAISVEQARLFEEAKLAEVARLLGDIGHDLKNMLMPVLNGAWLLQDELKSHFGNLPPIEANKAQVSQELSKDLIDMIVNNARRIQDRVREIADSVKGATSPLHVGPCKVEDVVSSVIDTLRFFASEKGVALRTVGLETLPVIQADEHRLFNAFYNLINNAIPEVPAGGSITVRGWTNPDDPCLHLSVADTGRGMSPEVRESLFTKQVMSRKAGGTGLGTKIVKDVVDAHHGRITVDSEVGVGTTFYIELPLDR